MPNYQSHSKSFSHAGSRSGSRYGSRSGGSGSRSYSKDFSRDRSRSPKAREDFSADFSNNAATVSGDLNAADAPAKTFAELGVPQPLVRVLAADGKTTAFPIQADTLADSLAGRDLLGRGRTGSGKTLAFAIPLVARLNDETSVTELAMQEFEQLRNIKDNDARRKAMLPHPRGLVLAPTRELVNQIDEVIRPLADAYGMSTATIYGGVKYSRQIAELRDGADIIVACPGRLEDLLRQNALSLESVEITVLDEADEMADMGFLPAVTRLLEQVDADGQRMLFSATLDHGVDKVVKRFLTDARVHAVDDADAQVDTMTHHVFAVSQGNKHEVIRELASGKGKRILFTRTKFQAKNMAKKLVDQGIPAVDLQGNLNQNQRDRNLAAFSSGEVRVLVATDVAARGIDVSDVEMVVQTEPPEDPKSFLHRSGRTARAGEKGDVVTLVLPNQERGTRSMMRRAGIQVQCETITPNSPVLEELVGEHAPLVHGWTLSVPVVNPSAGRSRRRKGSGSYGKNAGGQYRKTSGSERKRSAEGLRPRDEKASGGKVGKYDNRKSTASTEQRREGKRSQQWNDWNTDSRGSRGENGRGGRRSAAGFRSSRSGKRAAAPFRSGR
ncbi:ATP-dependent RNA helicase [Bifidobacterium lemurum]|uniref:ATP-dependent RNA helicase n=1 Tax=Bifidobacterium lemurum TaxID=1603886 RepID=A0A261FTX5_9BIFI|nr:ATP-dependent RNA helicase [Bifidobacterium lemurum]